VLLALLAVAGTRTGKWSSWKMSSSKVFISCSCLWLLYKTDPPACLPTPRHPVHCWEDLRTIVTPKSFHRSLWGSLFYTPATAHEDHECSSIHPTMSLNFLQSLEE